VRPQRDIDSGPPPGQTGPGHLLFVDRKVFIDLGSFLVASSAQAFCPPVCEPEDVLLLPLLLRRSAKWTSINSSPLDSLKVPGKHQGPTSHSRDGASATVLYMTLQRGWVERLRAAFKQHCRSVPCRCASKAPSRRLPEG
jgi:hypothetical protein